MSQKMEISCISDLMSNDISYISLQEALKRGARNVVENEDIIIVSDDVEGSLYIACNDLEVFKNNEENIDYQDYYFVNIYNADIRDYLLEKYKFFSRNHAYYIYMYYKKEKFELNDSDFRILDISYFDVIRSTYDLLSDEEIKERLYSSNIFGLFKEDKLVGFIGIHREHEIGIFIVFEEYRHQGYGYELEANLINYMIDNEMMIYCHVDERDDISLKLQEKLGLKKSDSLHYWLNAYEKEW